MIEKQEKYNQIAQKRVDELSYRLFGDGLKQRLVIGESHGKTKSG